MPDDHQAAIDALAGVHNGVASVWQHPDGKTITVFSDDTYLSVGPDGKRKKTSATPEKLRAGYGRWKEVTT